jgi:RNA polymerase sigma factor (sigma-70 family)
MTEKQLLERFITDHDGEAFRALVERHGPMVHNVCRSILVDPHDVEDAFQSTFMALARNAATITYRDSISAWLHRVAVRVARKARFRAAGRRAHERVSDRPRPEYADPDPGMVAVVREEVSRLPERYRVPLVLCYLEGKTNEEAALQLRCPVGTVKGRLWRARGRLRDRLCRRGLSLSEVS